MYFEQTNIENTKVDLKLLTEIMEKHGFALGESYDYERVSFDKKVVIKEGTYYVRIFGVAIEGDVGANDALIQLKKPVIGKHYYPHGVEYEDEDFPNHLVKSSQAALLAVKDDLKAYEVHS